MTKPVALAAGYHGTQSLLQQLKATYNERIKFYPWRFFPLLRNIQLYVCKMAFHRNVTSLIDMNKINTEMMELHTLYESKFYINVFLCEGAV